MAETTPSPTKKNILILGGSYGGISIAHHLLKHTFPVLPNASSYQIILVSSASQAMCRPACPRALISDDFFDQEKLFVSIPAQFAQYPDSQFRFIHGSATSLDIVQRTVTITPNTGGAGEEKLAYHALVIATGSTTASPLHGLNRADVPRLRDSWTKFRTALPSAKTIVISGGGPNGIETAGELGEYLNGRPGFFSPKVPSNPKVSITLVTSAQKILPILRTSITEKAENLLAQVGVTLLKNARVVGVTPEGAGSTDDLVASKAVVRLEDGRELEADLYIPCTGTTPNTQFIDGRESGLLAGDGRVKTNEGTLRVDKAGERVYAIGDAANYARAAIHLLMEAVPVLAANIKKDLLEAEGGEGNGKDGKGDKKDGKAREDRIYKADNRETHLVPLGKSKGVGAAMGWQLPSIMVWAIKGRDYWLWTVRDLWSGKQWSKEG